MSIWTATDFNAFGTSRGDWPRPERPVKVSTGVEADAVTPQAAHSPDTPDFDVIFLTDVLTDTPQERQLDAEIRALTRSRAEGDIIAVGTGSRNGHTVCLAWTDTDDLPRTLLADRTLGDCHDAHGEAGCSRYVVGYGRGEQTEQREVGLLWTPGSDYQAVSLHPAAVLGDEGESRACGVWNNIVIGSGQGQATGQQSVALFWTLTPTPTGLIPEAHLLHPDSLLGEYGSSLALAVTAGCVVGYGRGSATANRDHALVWKSLSRGAAVDLHSEATLGEYGSSCCCAVSGTWLAGHGRGERTLSLTHALLWTAPRADAAVDIHPYGLLGGQSCSYVTALFGTQVVGFGRGNRTDSQDHALLWLGPEGSEAIDLHRFAPSGALASRAYTIDPLGNIAGWIDGKPALWRKKPGTWS